MIIEKHVSAPYGSISELSREGEDALRTRIDGKTKPPGSLGRLEELALKLGLMQGTAAPTLQGAVLVVAGDHGLAEEGVSPFPQAVTAQMVLNFLHGGAAINVLVRQMGLPLKVIDAGVASELPSHPDLVVNKLRAGTRNALREAALTPEEVEAGLDIGAGLVDELAAKGVNALLLGEMGIGNTSTAALIMSALLELPVAECVGRGITTPGWRGRSRY
ncbi:MAG: nicotinate-nucleotide--dimethylbenzimidazole phosphoribosyltransferase [Candidatus Synoicihabitans palmerolidicus]|nr:nicotinate-nucleotide--dimethylbenzimidazole phosphoribosyltransferase [Candidatus Synoicihabitans palmerolidicus]